MSTTEFRDRVRITVADGIADVRMTRADKRNALDMAMFGALADAGDYLKTAPGVRVAVLSGEGKSFCAGLDMSVMTALAGNREEAAAQAGDDNPGAMSTSGITHRGQQVAWVWQEVPVPVIAAMHGHALGGGIQIALGADIRVVHPDTKLSVREVYWGLVPDMTGTLFLARLVGADVAKELVFTARIFDGREGHRLGLATRLADDPHAEAMSLAAQIAALSPDAVRGAKELLNQLFNAGAGDQFAREREVIGRLVGRPNQVEAVMASFENRPASFTDPT